MDWPIEILLLLVLAATLAGFIDSISGGGGIIGVPSLMLAGLSPAQALGTNKFQALFGKLSAVRYFLKHQIIDLKSAKLPIVVCFFASFFGAQLVQTIDQRVLMLVMPWLILAAAVYILFTPRLSDVDTKQRISFFVFALTAVPLCAFYDGFFGPASGSFFAISFIALLGFGATKATAYSKLLLLVSNFAAVLGFAMGGQINLLLGGLMACGQWAGARVGSQLVHKKGSKIVRPMLIVMSLILVSKMLYDQIS